MANCVLPVVRRNGRVLERDAEALAYHGMASLVDSN
jgi:hypothetical protein